MGSELSTKTKPGLSYNRHIAGFAAGTKEIEEILLLRNGQPLHVFKPKAPHFEFIYDDTEPLSKILLTSPGEKPPFVYYYIRVLQKDGHIAWGSPIWIDYVPGQEVVSPATAPGSKKAKK